MGKVALLSQKDAIVELFVYQKKLRERPISKFLIGHFYTIFREYIHEKSENSGEKMQKFA